MEPKNDFLSSYTAGMNGMQDGSVAALWGAQSRALDRQQEERVQESIRQARAMRQGRSVTLSQAEERPPPCHAKYSDAGGRIGILVGISLALLSTEYRNAGGMLFLAFAFYVVGWCLGAVVYALVQPWVFRLGLTFLVIVAVCTLIEQIPQKPHGGDLEIRKWSDTPTGSKPPINRGGFQGKIQY